MPRPLCAGAAHCARAALLERPQHPQRLQQQQLLLLLLLMLLLLLLLVLLLLMMMTC